MRTLYSYIAMLSLTALPLSTWAGWGGSYVPPPVSNEPPPVYNSGQTQIYDPADYAAECADRTPKGTHWGPLVIDEPEDALRYRCITSVQGHLTVSPNNEMTHLIMPWILTVNGNLYLNGSYALQKPRLPRLQTVHGEIRVDGQGVSEWRVMSMITHSQRLYANTQTGANLRGFDNLQHLHKLELRTPASTNVNTNFISQWKGLAGLVTAGSIKITDNEGVASSDFLSSLDEVSGTLDVDVDQHLFGLDALRVVGGHVDIRVSDTWKVGYAHGLESLEEVGGDFVWDDSGSKIYGGLSGLGALTHVGGDLVLPLYVSSLAGLNSLQTIGGDFTLEGHVGWGDLAPLATLTQIGGELTIQDLSIASLNGLHNLASAGSLRVHNNTNLGNVSALTGLFVGGVSGAAITITNNSPLTNCQANDVVSTMTAWFLPVNVSGNQSCFIYRGFKLGR